MRKSTTVKFHDMMIRHFLLMYLSQSEDSQQTVIVKLDDDINLFQRSLLNKTLIT